MHTPPFKLSPGGLAALVGAEGPRAAAPGGRLAPVACCEEDRVAELVAHEDAAARAPAPSSGAATNRMRLHQLDPHLHCSVIGNCLGTAELRRLMGRHVEVAGLSDLDVHHAAVSLAVQGGEVSKALHKALDQRHAGAVRAFAAAADEAALDAAWREAWQRGEVQGAYWALLTHKAVTPALRQTAFGEVHMLSHLMASANRHELKRFVALEKGHAELEERLEREQARRQEALQERDRMAEQLRQQAIDFEGRLAQALASRSEAPMSARELGEQVAIQAERRERAERQSEDAARQLASLKEQLERVQAHGRAQAEELAAAEAELHRLSAGVPDTSGDGAALLAQRRVLYVGGRPSSTPAIRDYVECRGGEFLHHDGGLEARKGLLAALLPRADLVVFPVDCIDHDSALNLKRLAERHQVPFLALRSASLASFAAAVRRELVPSGDGQEQGSRRFCLRHA
ncbi:DUF2325 domain-containing protein [Mitsuaria sp. GD03876]|uniref:DUF2325 domain-containing protein n=1 Tax=Mitsuaria sp. GD03876 TaxID=2975399 RepID=UPI00244856E1|nr:DUF2325 domain-containing protein [Mitsuaria sp. GD03876]MDH0867821.1 DUF2325 domain-containing protein [Mitsuaria sp. GD03876]